MRIGKWIIVLFAFSLVALVVFGYSKETTETDDDMKKTEDEKIAGGELRVAISAQPPTLDTHIVNSIATTYVTGQFFESLVTVNNDYEVVPQLAESIEISEDGKTYTFPIRKEVLFHNGKEMTAEDIAASLNRWKDITPTGVLKSIQEGQFSVKDQYTVVLEVKEPSPLTLFSLAAHRYSSVMPKEVIDSADSTGVKEFIGTGPFKLVEWKQDQYIHLTKFEDYQPVDLPSDATSGRKEALVDDIYFEIVADASTQVAGVQTGEYDMVLDLPNEYYEQVKSNPDLEVDVTMYGTMNLVFNKNESWFADVKMRQAVNAALNFEEILLAAFINKDLYRANSSYMLKEKNMWYSDSGGEFYNQQDLDKAKTLLEESGYNGETITLITTRDYEHIYSTAVVTKEQLEKIGMKVELEIYDWPTVSSKIQDPKSWHLFATGYAGISTPTETVFFNKNYYDGPKDKKTEDLLLAIETAVSEEEAQRQWYELQGHSWEYLPVIKFGDFPKITVLSNKVKGYEYFNVQPILWNTSNNK